MHQCWKFGENTFRIFQDIVLTMFGMRKKTDACMHERPENIMPPAILSWQRHKKHLSNCESSLWHGQRHIIVLRPILLLLCTHIEDVLQSFLGIGLLQAHLGKTEVGSCKTLAKTCIVPTRGRHINQTVAEKQNEQRQTPGVTGRHCQHLHLISATTSIHVTQQMFRFLQPEPGFSVNNRPVNFTI